MPTKSPYQLHVQKWKGCADCVLAETRNKTCLYRGSIPCDFLIVGEGPSKNEDLLGKPFVGPSSNLLTQLIDRSGISAYSHGFTNLLACAPLVEGQIVPPSRVKKSVTACSSRVREIYTLARPKVIVTLGKDPQKFFEKELPHWDEDEKRDTTLVSVLHPGAILRLDISQKDLAIQRVMIALEDAVKDHQSR